jgi:iron(III) transport system substrate-binding protein
VNYKFLPTRASKTPQPPNPPNAISRNIRIAVGALLFCGAVLYALWRTSQDPLVVYCAHDAVYAASIIKAFEAETGIRCVVRYDTEATKSLGLVESLIREEKAPRCDVFWNNELLGTMDLAERGILQGYHGIGFQRIPDAFKDPDGRWIGFGARMRVYIVNTDNVAADYNSINKYLQGDRSRMAIAKPLYGTTLTHYTILWKELGAEGLQAMHQDWIDRGIKQVNGNATVKNLVAAGVCDLGWTDTDDAFVAVEAGEPVAMLPVKLTTGHVVCIPNTVSIIKGSSQPKSAQLLLDYLLSERCEVALANSASRQIPLGPVDDTRLPESVRALRHHVSNGYPLHDLGAARKGCIEWLKTL